jgi:predicted Zn-dependent protease with MMP-like domain
VKENLFWETLEAIAMAEVQSLLDELPEDITESLQEVPITFERRPNPALVRSGLDRLDTLGLFTGVPMPHSVAVSQQLPPQIILFLENIWEYSRYHEPAFKQQVRKTLLHEIGHYLGLDEDDLRKRRLS